MQNYTVNENAQNATNRIQRAENILAAAWCDLADEFPEHAETVTDIRRQLDELAGKVYKKIRQA